jgi:spore coat protein CotH
MCRTLSPIAIVALATVILGAAQGVTPTPGRSGRGQIAASGAASLDPVKGTANDFFGLTKLYTFQLTIAPTDFQRMHPANGVGGRGMARVTGLAGGGDDSGYVEVPATLQFEGKDWGTVSVRFKGSSSYKYAPSELKRSLKVDFNASDKSRTFFGMRELNLNNNAFDSSQMREALAYDVFRHAGVAAPRTAFARVLLTVPGTHDRRYVGLFTVVEQVGQTFFRDRWGHEVGVLLKPEGLHGMPYLGNDWTKYEGPYSSRVTAKPDAAARFIAFVKLLNEVPVEEFAKRIGEYLDVDQFLHFLAAEVVLVNTDSPLAMNHNYWATIHPTTQKVVWVPWDVNMAFAGFVPSGADLSLHKPSEAGVFPLVDRIFSIDGMVKRYDQIVREMVTTNFTVSRLAKEIQSIEATIREAVAADETTTAAIFARNVAEQPPPAPPGGGSGPPLRQFVVDRVESVISQLEGKREGTPGVSGRRGVAGAR